LAPRILIVVAVVVVVVAIIVTSKWNGNKQLLANNGTVTEFEKIVCCQTNPFLLSKTYNSPKSIGLQTKLKRNSHERLESIQSQCC